MRKSLIKILVVILFLSGLSLLAYPFAANEWNSYRQEQLIDNYQSEIGQMEEEGTIDYRAEEERAHAYNEALLPSILPDSFAVAAADAEPEREYMACLNLAGDGIMGTVDIPGIEIELPVFHTTSEEVLLQGAGHLEGSSLPVGGTSTHAVISAHRGLPSAALFTDLDKLEEGELFFLHVLDRTLCYEVDQISVVDPEDTEKLSVEEGKDLVTLLTCTPYGVNSHRLLVRGHRIPYTPDKEAEASEAVSGPSLYTNYLFWLVAGLAVTAVLVFWLYRRERKKSGNTALKHRKGTVRRRRRRKRKRRV